MDVLALIRPIEEVIVDPFFVVDARRVVIHFNRAFVAMLPRAIARGLRGKKLEDVVEFHLPDDPKCIVTRCWEAGTAIRLDEIPGNLARGDIQMTFILSALPFYDEQGKPTAAMVVQRNVTDEAQVQTKYQEMLETTGRERDQLKQVIRERTKDLLATNDQLLRVQRELMALKRGMGL